MQESKVLGSDSSTSTYSLFCINEVKLFILLTLQDYCEDQV